MIHWTRHGTIAVVTIDNPPVNAGSHGVRKGLLDAISEIAAHADIEGVVLMGAGKTFISGSDIREFGKPLLEPQLPSVIEAIEKLDVPVAAAICGAALGGGYELALGCDLRIADRSAVVGLPEVSLGLVPGAGGTQRLPRLAGIPVALELVVSARRVKAEEALKLGMIDALSTGSLLEDAIAALRQLAGKRRVADMPVPHFDRAEAQTVRARVVARAKGRPAAIQAADLVLSAAENPFHAALAGERAAFQAIRVSPEAFAHRHVFFAERNAARAANPDAVAASVRHVAIIGGGTMGAGIAHAFLSSGHDVTLIERDEAALMAGEARIAGLRMEDVTRGRLSESGAERQVAALRLSVDLRAAAAADLIIEAVFEDLDVKRVLLEQLGAVAGPEAVIATNTSYLDIDAMAKGLPHPHRFVGLHFFAPAHVMKLLEIVLGEHTDERTLSTALSVARSLGKQAVVARNAYGFIGNRIYNAYRRHAEFLVQDGATPAAVDRAMTEFGMAMGPFAVADLSGLDIAWRMRKSQAAARDPAIRYVDIADRLCEAGRLGRKTGAGYYDYASGKAEPAPDIEVHIETSRDMAGIKARHIGPDEIRARCLGAMVNEGALLLADGIARQACDIDVALIHGYGFPRWAGGPVWWAAQLSEQERNMMMQQVADAEGHGFRRGNIEALVASLT